MGVRSVFFLRKDHFTSSSEDEGPFDLDVMKAAESDHTPTEPFTPAPTPPSAGGDTPNPGDYDLQARTREECHFGLDEAFELELNTLGLTCLIDRPLCVRKHLDIPSAEGPSKHVKRKPPPFPDIVVPTAGPVMEDLSAGTAFCREVVAPSVSSGMIGGDLIAGLQPLLKLLGLTRLLG